MQDFMEKLSEMAKEDFKAYREVMEYCEKRITGEEGIPAIIGLDDLTDGAHTVFKGAPMDEKMNLEMALDVLIFNWLYSQKEELDPHYRSIAPAMSAVAEKLFYIPEGESSPKQYREMLGEKVDAEN